MRHVIILGLILMVFNSCEKGIEVNKFEELIVGEWSHSEYNDSLSILSKVRSLSGDQYGIRFNSDGSLTEIKNAGWCGTPPISYGEFEGSWQIRNNSILEINSTYWGGDIFMEWELIEIDGEQMIYYVWEIETTFSSE